jgi:hypothetical protein
MNRNTYLSQADQLLKKTGPFTREDSAKVEQLIAMAEATTDYDGIRRATSAARDAELGRLPQIRHSLKFGHRAR